MEELAAELGHSNFIMPVGLFLVVDAENGGDPTAQEVVRRFNLLDLESRNVIDFYFLGWNKDYSRGIRFDIRDFLQCRSFLGSRGVRQFGGNADLILVDAVRDPWNNRITLNFPQAIRVDLSASKENKDFPTVGGFLQSIIVVAEQIKIERMMQNEDNDIQGVGNPGVVFSMSNRLGLAIAKTSMLDFILEKWGKVIGAKSLKQVAMRNLGSPISFSEYEE
jgi:hypothetical protein